MTTSYEVKIEYPDHAWEVLTLIGVREYGARGHDGKPESVALLCRSPMLRAKPIDMILFCPVCGMQHIDASESENTYTGRLHESSWWELGGDKPERWTNPPHRSHLCSNCGHQWRPADVATNGVAEIQTRGKNDHPTIRGVRSGDTMPQPWHERPEHGDTPRRRRILEREKAEAGGLVLNTDGLPRLYSVAFRPEGGFLVEPVVGQYVTPSNATPTDTEIEMDRRQAERADFVKNASADEMAARAERMNEGAKRAAGVLRGSVAHTPEWLERPERWTSSFNLQWRDALLDRLRGVLAFPGTNGSAVSIANIVAVVREAVSFLESLAP